MKNTSFISIVLTRSGITTIAFVFIINYIIITMIIIAIVIIWPIISQPSLSVRYMMSVQAEFSKLLSLLPT